MNSFKSIETIYKVLLPKFGHLEATNALSDVLAVVLHRLNEEGLAITEENIQHRLVEIANDYIEASKSNVA